jgi:hypothetical protein
VNLNGFVRNNSIGSIDILGLYETDFHYYVVYYLLRAACFTAEEADILAGFSQGIDDNDDTEPVRTVPAVRAFYHFAGSTPKSPTRRDDPGARSQLKRAFSRCACDPIQFNRIAYNVGAALHVYADTFAHEGFTAWHNSSINRRTDNGWPDVGHADAAEGGHAPDLPYLDRSKALEAAQKIYSLIPDRCSCVGDTRAPWETLKPQLEAAFVAERDLNKRIHSVSQLIQKAFSDAPIYDESRYSQIPER